MTESVAPEVSVKRFHFVVSKHEYKASSEGEKGSDGEGGGESGGEGSEGGGNA